MTASRRALDTGFLVLVAISVLSVFLRFWDLEVKPLHHDEAVNGFFLDKLIEKNSYQYNPENYHGPLIYYLGLLSVELFGRSIFALRFFSALLGAFAVVLLLQLKERLGKLPAAGAAALLAASPTFVYYNREFIHETYLVFFTLFFFLLAERFSRTRSRVALALASLSLALCFATKETALLHSIVMLAALAIATGARAGQGWPGLVGVVRRFVGDAARAFRSIIRGRRFAFAASVVLFWAVIVVLFSSFFTNFAGIADFFAAFTAWARTGVETSGHTKPVFYFIPVLWQLEPLALILGALGLAGALHSQDTFERFVSFWALLTFALYSAIPYKTPWLTMNIMAPLIVSAGCFMSHVQRALKGRRTAAAVCVAAFVGAVAWSASLAWDISLVRYDDNTEPLVYVHTFREINDLVGRIEDVASRIRWDETRILVFADTQWPLSWYLHHFDCAFPETITAHQVDRADIIIASIDQEKDIEELGKGRFVCQRYNLRPGASLSLFVPREFAGTSPQTPGQAQAFLPLGTRVPLARGLVASYFKGQQLLPPAYRVEVQNEVAFEFDDETSRDFAPPVSIRWEGYLKVPQTGEYSFFLTSDDGSRFFLDDVLLIDNWGEHAAAAKAASATLAGGYHHVRVEYFDCGWGAVIRLEWQPPGRDMELLTSAFLRHLEDDAVE
ncbi:MAG: TIGR03663 family protein [Candidatus Coatesbacteria bacterium]|nr:TIGR03663 family protein [Candidatus Coatesbacteria bacterium]